MSLKPDEIVMQKHMKSVNIFRTSAFRVVGEAGG
jgi:hypothetical protein